MTCLYAKVFITSKKGETHSSLDTPIKAHRVEGKVDTQH
jgi:hypothetical protein